MRSISSLVVAPAAAARVAAVCRRSWKRSPSRPLDATEEQLSERSRPIYRLLRLPDAEIRVLLQRTDDEKVSKERMHLDLETDDVEAEVRRLEGLGATRYDHQQERGYDFWVLRDPWHNEFCVLQINFPDLLAQRPAWPDSGTAESGSN